MFVILASNAGQEIHKKLTEKFEPEILGDSQFAPEVVNLPTEKIWMFPKSTWILGTDTISISGSRQSVQHILTRIGDELAGKLKCELVIFKESKEKDWPWFTSIIDHWREKIIALRRIETDADYDQVKSELTVSGWVGDCYRGHFYDFFTLLPNLYWSADRDDRIVTQRIIKLYNKASINGVLDFDHHRGEITELINLLQDCREKRI